MGTETITLEVSQDMLAALKMGATDLGAISPTMYTVFMDESVL
jgi:hypothetical protein